ncbi:MAG TPA: ABC transporter ATP-binding protein [Gemmataceae bacterium]|nr:ABC transporter ATP-binding protein [Gemmataceae bacterium]
MILLDKVSIRQGAFRLDDVSLTVPTGRYGVLMGPTGCGKTSLLEAIAGLRPLVGGMIVLGERDVTRLTPGDRGVGYVPQDAALFRTMSVSNHLAFALNLRGERRSAVEQRVRELADWLAIAHLLNRRPHGLSGGEAQRVALGRALSFRPKYLLLDEPLSALDETTRGSIVDLLDALRKAGEVTVLHVTHSRAEAERLADVCFQLNNGTLTCA